MSSRIKVRCSNGHVFPVNLEKNKYRDYVMCPKCRNRVVVRKKHFFSPNPKWEEQKNEARKMRERMKGMKRPTPVGRTPSLFSGGRIFGALAFSRMVKKRMEEKKLEEKRRNGNR